MSKISVTCDNAPTFAVKKVTGNPNLKTRLIHGGDLHEIYVEIVHMFKIGPGLVIPKILTMFEY